ncbi:hypothetical protein DFH08DRAFT_992529 [Mycena albidolilacea]|uniref:Uncharacterized protein n=1 Tax=Mycena albidolilacea TaxID=1033008 RepID=A0AAD7A7H8_9AGAR|nr:hypothetical protein DFH08DRAFT_992529 [Mycena albidolilacea]
MLPLLILVHLLTRSSATTPVALPLASQSSADSRCDDIYNCRKLFDIVWGCLATIFAYTWVSVHPNVPPPDQSWLARFWRRLKMMLIGIIAPEIMSMAFENPRIFFCMGGFVSSARYHVVKVEQLEDADLGPEFLKTIQNVDTEDIRDKSKGDALSKGVTLAQGIWFTTQCLARVHQHLVITELEVATLGFARPIIIGPPKPLDAQPIKFIPMSRWNQFLYSLGGDAESGGEYNPLSSTSAPSFWSPVLDNNLQIGTMGITALAGSVFGAIHCAAWTIAFPTTADMWMWRSCSVVITAIPVVFFLAALAALLIGVMYDTPFKKTKLGNTIDYIAGIVFFGSFPIYILARLILIALSFAALRSLPPSALGDLNWSTYIPHI